MSYQNADLEAEEASLLSATETEVKTTNTRALYLAAAALTSIFVVAATMQSLRSPRAPGATNLAKVLYANDKKDTWGNWDGSLKYLDRHNVNCWDQALNTYQWNAWNRRFDYTCANSNGISVTSSTTKYTDWQWGGNKGIYFLDRHHLSCGGNSLLTSFKVETKGWWGDDIRYRYDCKEYGPVDNFQCSDWKHTDYQETGPDWTLAYLDRHKIECGKFEGLKEIKANTNWGRIQFAYKCCSMNSDRILASQSELFWDKTKVQMDFLGTRWPVSTGTHKLLDKLIWEYTNPACGVENNCIQEFFPEANGVGDIDYHKNDWLLQYSRLMLAFVVSGYLFNDGKDGGKLLAITPLINLHQEPTDFCTAKNSNRPINYDELVTARGTTEDWLGPGTAASLYEYETDDEYLIVWNFRGSQIGLDVTKLPDFVKDWIGSDLDMNPSPDEVCFKPQVEMHSGMMEAFLIVKEQMISAVTASYKKFKMRGDKPVKIFITGHSLGAALSVVATYNIFCAKLFGEDIDYKNTVYNIAFGVLVVFYGPTSVKAYQSVVPVENRIRINACSPFSNLALLQKCESGLFKGLNLCHAIRTGNGCDIVGGSFPKQGLIQPNDQDFQAAMQPEWAYTRSGNHLVGRSPCTGMLDGALCHLLDRYLWGLLDKRFDKFCEKETVSANS